uniref:N-acetyltransferase domain-containing protein n=1 Tax=viral metagenome TaxID=1070528 RepID=A0A6C0LHP0_9ZZZZ
MATEPKENQEFYCYITRITLDYNNIINDNDKILKNWIKKLNMLKFNLAKCYQKIIGRYGATEKTIDAYIEIILNSFREGTIKETIRNYNEIRDKEVQEDIERERIIIATKLERSRITISNSIYIEMLTTEDSRAAKNLYLEFKKELSEYEYEDEDEYIEKIEGYMDDFIQKNLIFGIFVTKKILAGFTIIDTTKKFKIDSSLNKAVCTYYIQEIFVSREYRTKDLKLGQKLFEYCIIRCPKNISYISLMTRPDNRAMILIAEKYGFVQQSITSGDDKNPLLLIKNFDKAENYNSPEYDITLSTPPAAED